MGWITVFGRREGAARVRPAPPVSDVKANVLHVEHVHQPSIKPQRGTAPARYLAPVDDLVFARSPSAAGCEGPIPLIDPTEIAKHDNALDGFCESIIGPGSFG